MPTWEVVLRVVSGIVLVGLGGFQIVCQLRTRSYGGEEFDWYRHHLNHLALIAALVGIALFVSAGI